MSKEIILIVRRDREYWLTDRYNNLAPVMLELIEEWNRTFSISFIEYRHRIRDIASSTYALNKFDKIFLHYHK